MREREREKMGVRDQKIGVIKFNMWYPESFVWFGKNKYYIEKPNYYTHTHTHTHWQTNGDGYKS